MTLGGSSAEPFQSFGDILWDSISQEIEAAEIGLGVTISLLCGPTEPTDRFLIVLRHPATEEVQPCQVVLSRGISLLGQWPPLLHSGGIVATFVGRHSFLEPCPH